MLNATKSKLSILSHYCRELGFYHIGGIFHGVKISKIGQK